MPNYGIIRINEPSTHPTTTPQRTPSIHITIIRSIDDNCDVPMHYYELHTIIRC